MNKAPRFLKEYANHVCKKIVDYYPDVYWKEDSIDHVRKRIYMYQGGLITLTDAMNYYASVDRYIDGIRQTGDIATPFPLH